MKKRFLAFLMVTFLLCGCTSYERDESAGEVIQISLADMESMMKKGQEFTIAFTQSMCVYCEDFHELFENYRQNHHVVLYEVPLEREKEQPNVNRAIIQQYFPEFDKTPGIFYANGGKCIDSIHQSQRMTEELFDNWVKKHKLDKKVN